MGKRGNIANTFRFLLVLVIAMLSQLASAQTAILTEDFSGTSNIFTVSATEISAGTPAIYDSGLNGFGKVLAVCKATATATFDSDADTDGNQPLSVESGVLTVEWDAFHGWYGMSRTSTVSLINSDGEELASYIYDCSSCNITSVKIGGSWPSDFTSFNLQSHNTSGGAQGWSGKNAPYIGGDGYNPHIRVNITSDGTVVTEFSVSGQTTSFSGTIGSLKNNVAQMKVVSYVENVDRCYAIDNIVVSTSDTKYCTVTYNVMETTTTETVEQGSVPASIPDTYRGGYIFKGWTATGSSQYDETITYLSTDDLASTPITDDITYTAVYVDDPTYIEAISSISISGNDKMVFGESTDVAYSNPYSVVITGVDGTTITEGNMSSLVNDFNVTWDIEGFKTDNDTEGQYCDSYGSFSVNNAGKVATTFDLKDVPMNFYGRMTATVTYNGTAVSAKKYVVALGNLQKSASQVLPVAGYPSNYTSYPDELLGYQAVYSSDGTDTDVILGEWCAAGSDGSCSATLSGDSDGSRYVRLKAVTFKKSHVFTKSFDPLTSQTIFDTTVRFNSGDSYISLTSTYPTWVGMSSYSCPVSLDFDGSSLSLNGNALSLNGAKSTFSTGNWYRIVLSADNSSGKCYALVYDSEGNLLGESGLADCNEGSAPTFFNYGMGNTTLSSFDIASCEAFLPTPDDASYTLSADKTTLSIPNGETARLTASIIDSNGYIITQNATWTVLEEDMNQGITIVPDSTDSHSATLLLADDAEAGTATIQVNIGGYTRTVTINLTTNKESIKFTKSTTNISIPADNGDISTAAFEAIIIDGNGNPIGNDVSLAVYDKDGAQPYTLDDGITFDSSTGLLSVSSDASPAIFTIRASGLNSEGEMLSKTVKMNVHGLTFDFGFIDDESVAAGFTVVGTSTAYSSDSGYGIVSGNVVEGGSGSDSDATADWLEGAMEFDAKVQKGKFYTVEVTYQGTLTTGYINSDLAGYTLGNHSSMTTETYTIPATRDFIDLHVSDYLDHATDATSVAQIAKVTIVKQADRKERTKPVVHHIGDSTSANRGSWAYTLVNSMSSYPNLSALCTFHNDGAGGRNLSTYYTQGKLADVLCDIYPGDILMFGNNGTNGMGSSFEEDMNYYLDAAETLGAKVIINTYTPHGAVTGTAYASGYDQTSHTFNSYRKDSYETVVRKVAAERAESDENYLGMVEIGKNADAIFNAYVADYASNGYSSANDAALAIISCFSDHNHYSAGTLACQLMLNGYAKSDAEGIVSQMISLISPYVTSIAGVAEDTLSNLSSSGLSGIYTMSGQRIGNIDKPGIYVVDGQKILVKDIRK